MSGPAHLSPAVQALVIDRPLAFLDLETTGTDTAKDRIVGLALVIYYPRESGSQTIPEPVVKSGRLNPGVPVPPEATAVHGITDADVADKPTFRRFALSLYKHLKDADLAGFGIRRFDLPLLLAEWKRAGITAFHPRETSDGRPRRILDLLALYHLEHARDLSAAVRDYTGRSLDEAHAAQADTEVLPLLLEGMLDAHDHLARNLDELHARCDEFAPFRTELERWFGEDLSAPVFQFGKHQGKTLDHVWECEADYIGWMIRQDDVDPMVKDFVRDFRQRPQLQRAGAQESLL